MKQDFIPAMFKTIDQFGSRSLADMITENGSFRFANMPAVVGRENIFQFLEGFFKSIKAISHTDLEYWFVDNVWIATGNVTYTRHNGSLLRVPFSVILKMDKDLISEYLIFVDASTLYQ